MVTQFAQRAVQNLLIRPALSARSRPVRMPHDLTRVPVLAPLARRFVGLGVLPEHVESPVFSHPV